MAMKFAEFDRACERGREIEYNLLVERAEKAERENEELRRERDEARGALRKAFNEGWFAAHTNERSVGEAWSKYIDARESGGEVE